jgi:putative protease
MKIVAPLTRKSEVAMLVANGAEEFYTGFIPPDWIEAFGWGMEAVSRRLTPTANHRSWESFAETVAEAHDHGVEVYLTLNAPQYSVEAIPALERLAAGAADVGIDGFIVADPEIVLRLRKSGLPGAIHVSSVAAVRNREAFEMFIEMGARRIILPRQITVKEVRALREAAPDVEIEAFVINDTCVFDEAMCFTSHACSGPVLCRRPYEMEPVEAVTGNPIDGEARAEWIAHREDWGRWLGATGEMGFSPGRVPEGPCGLCAIPGLVDAGVDALKVVGREANPLRKLLSVQSVRAVLDHVRNGHDEWETIAHAIAIRKTPTACRVGFHCYYRDVHHDRVLPTLGRTK